MEGHMPPAHRAFLRRTRAGGGVRAFCGRGGPSLAAGYNDCVSQLERFRAAHRSFASAYIAKFARGEGAERGTGGSDFMPALGGYRASTAAHRLP